MIITPQEAAKLLNNHNNLLRGESTSTDEEQVIAEIVNDLVNPNIPILQAEKGERRNIPPIFRELIAVQANVTGNASSVAAAFGISNRHAHELKGGNVHRPDQREKYGLRESDKELAQALEASLSKIRNKAIDKIYASMDAIQEEALVNEPPKVLAVIASNLSRVVASTLRDKKETPTVNVQTVFYSPNVTAKESYEVIDV